MKPRTKEALYQMAHRGGTEHEKILARTLLARAGYDYKKKYKPPVKQNNYTHQYTKTTYSTECLCACGNKYPRGQSCDDFWAHSRIRNMIRAKFPKGTRVYYNRWAYARNTPGTVVGYSNWNGDRWAWTRIKFDHLKTVRSVPVYSVKGWHLSTTPLDIHTADLFRTVDVDYGTT